MTLIEYNKIVYGREAMASTFTHISDHQVLGELVNTMQYCLSMIGGISGQLENANLTKAYAQASTLYFKVIPPNRGQIKYVNYELGTSANDKNELINALNEKDYIDLFRGVRVWAGIFNHSSHKLHYHEVEKLFQTIKPIKLVIEKYLYEMDEN